MLSSKSKKQFGISGRLAFALILAGIVTMAACSGGDGTTESVVTVHRITKPNSLGSDGNNYTYPGANGIQFAAKLNGEDIPAGQVEFSVKKSFNSGTRFDGDKLRLGLNEQDGISIEIWAKLSTGEEGFTTMQIDKGVFVPDGITVSQPFPNQMRSTSQPLYASVTGKPDYLSGKSNDSVTWEVYASSANSGTAETASGTMMIGNELTIASKEALTDIKVRAVATGGGQKKESSPYEIALKGPRANNPEWLDVSSGIDHAMAIDGNYKLYTWGRNDSGQLGVGDNAMKNVPTAAMGIPSGEKVLMVSGGWGHTIALTDAKKIYIAGGIFDWLQGGKLAFSFGNEFKQLGSESNWLFIHAIHSGLFALNAQGQLFSLGHNIKNSLGIKDLPAGAFVSELTMVDSGDTLFGSITGNRAHSMAISREDVRRLYGWGDNIDGQLTSDSTSTTMQEIGKFATAGDKKGWLSAAAGRSGSLESGGWSAGITYEKEVDGLATGKLYTWGSNAEGRLGNGTTTNVSNSTPKIPKGLESINFGSRRVNFQATSSAVVIDNDGTMWSWGSNRYGQLGNHGSGGVGSASGTPKAIALPDGLTDTSQTPNVPHVWAMAIAGGAASYAIDTAGRLWAWGHNTWGQLGNGKNGNGTEGDMSQNQHEPQRIQKK